MTYHQFTRSSILRPWNPIRASSRFLKPVLIGDTIRPELEVTQLVPKTEVGLLRLTTRVKNQRGEVVLEGMHAYLVKKRPRT
jgi:acyl dehydratase